MLMTKLEAWNARWTISLTSSGSGQRPDAFSFALSSDPTTTAPCGSALSVACPRCREPLVVVHGHLTTPMPPSRSRIQLEYLVEAGDRLLVVEGVRLGQAALELCLRLGSFGRRVSGVGPEVVVVGHHAPPGVSALHGRTAILARTDVRAPALCPWHLVRVLRAHLMSGETGQTDQTEHSMGAVAR